LMWKETCKIEGVLSGALLVKSSFISQALQVRKKVVAEEKKRDIQSVLPYMPQSWTEISSS
jgi:hypothetical protein